MAVPKVSIIVPVYNAGDRLRRAVQSLVTQTLSDLEILLVDDGSTDRSRELIQELAATDSRIRPLFRSNGGVAAARNTGLAEARGTYIGFCDHDDRCAPELFARLYAAAVAADADLVQCAYACENDQGQLNYPIFEEAARMELARHDFRPQWNVFPLLQPMIWRRLHRRSFLEARNLRFNPKLRVGQDDAHFFFLTYAAANRLLILPEVGYFWHQAPGQFSRTADDRLWNALEGFDELEQAIVDNPEARALLPWFKLHCATVYAQRLPPELAGPFFRDFAVTWDREQSRSVRRAMRRLRTSPAPRKLVWALTLRYRLYALAARLQRGGHSRLARRLLAAGRRCADGGLLRALLTAPFPRRRCGATGNAAPAK